ncbi:uncharacterized protein LOC127749025 [Frankliniella occidentalis]|uniref:Uncharacterized protein LOC127749025 n=1 Tax=Frankliniella occidentalis TaxID=133901 RepID=A0A9C6TW88_FRAOC|nr:uncharacterized protein LOC127749025 [Frankliniella occidentalis]
MGDSDGMEKFEPYVNASSVGPRWRVWARQAKNYLEAKGFEEPKRQRAMFLHKAGKEVEEIFFATAPDDPVQPAPLPANPTAAQEEVHAAATQAFERESRLLFENAVSLLTRHFEPQKNHIYEREIFFDLRFEASDTVDSFVQKLRSQASYCDFGDEGDMIRDRLCARCPWAELKMELNKVIMAATAAAPFTLQSARTMSITYEKLLQQARATTDAVNRLQLNKKSSQKKGTDNKKNNGPKSADNCFRCGAPDHKGYDPSCPGLNQSCERCGIKGHVKKMCKTKKERVEAFKARRVDVPPVDSSDDEDIIRAFHEELPVCQLNSQDASEYIKVHLGYAKTRMLIDSGSRKNIIPKHIWEQIKKKFPGVFQEQLRVLCPYGLESGTRVQILGYFVCNVSLENGKTLDNVKFYVVDVPPSYEALLGKESALLLEVLRLGLGASDQLNAVSLPSTSIANNYPTLLKGVGRVANINNTIPMKKNSPGIIQPQRRVAFHYLRPMEEILSDLLAHDIIERVPPDHVSKFVSPSHLVPKKDSGKFRLVVDMRQVNQYVEEVMYPIPLVEDCLAKLNGSKIFSKIDFNLFFHQHAIAEESRDVGTFSTPFGLFRYKVLFFGLSCFPELAYSTVRSLTHHIKNFVLM